MSFHFALQAILTNRQEREIQLKMLLTRGEAVQRNTSAEGVPAIRKQIQDLKDSWDSMLSASIRCKRLWSQNNQSFSWLINWPAAVLFLLMDFSWLKGYRDN